MDRKAYIISVIFWILLGLFLIGASLYSLMREHYNSDGLRSQLIIGIGAIVSGIALFRMKVQKRNKQSDVVKS